MASQVQGLILSAAENMKTVMGVRWKKKFLVIVGVLIVFTVIMFAIDFQSSVSSALRFDTHLSPVQSEALGKISLLNEHIKKHTGQDIATFFNNNMKWKVDNLGAIKTAYSKWPEFVPTSNFSHAFFLRECVGRMDYNITGLVAVREVWAKSTNNDCLKLLSTFSTIFELEGRKGSLILTKLFEDKVRRWLGNNEELVREVYDQDVVHVVNRISREHTVFNPLRDKRPILPPAISEQKYVEDIVNETRQSCDFCNFKSYTAEHTFHRVESKHSFSASNIFKIDPLHALLAMKEHHPLNWSYEQYIDLMELTLTWLRKAKSNVPEAKFPSLIWDILPKCGASQIHPHMHVVFDPSRYHGEVEFWRRGAQDYYDETGKNYFTDLVGMYSLLNLTVRYGEAVAFASLVPKKDHEVVVMSKTADEDFFTLLYFVLRGFVDDVGKMCFSMGMGLPAMGESCGQIPAYARVITRGAVTDIRADMSSLELFMATNVNIDPWKTTGIVRTSVMNRKDNLLNQGRSQSQVQQEKRRIYSARNKHVVEV